MTEDNCNHIKDIFLLVLFLFFLYLIMQSISLLHADHLLLRLFNLTPSNNNNNNNNNMNKFRIKEQLARLVMSYTYIQCHTYNFYHYYYYNYYLVSSSFNFFVGDAKYCSTTSLTSSMKRFLRSMILSTWWSLPFSSNLFLQNFCLLCLKWSQVN